ncbi:MAG: heat-inducible transcriptional repressor HrcA [Coriobacteriales bacterium]|jgi:heat-inducible transcriptional repressor
MLSERRRKVLNALIEEYISTAAPVSSRAIVGNHSLGVSSATVRNELYVLEEDGYVKSPHVSSGRIPTDAGYRTFVDELLENIPEDSEEQTVADQSVAEDLRASADELDELLKRTSKVLNKFTDCLAVVMAPRVTKIALKQIALVQMDSRHVIVVVAIKDGRVVNKVVELEHDHSSEEIHALEMMLNEEYDIKGRFDPLTDSKAHTAVRDVHVNMRGELDKLISSIDDCLVEEERERVHLNGIDDLLSQPEMQNMALTMGFARLFEDDLMMFRLLGDLLASKGISVRIGHENADEALSDVSVVASSYGDDDGEGIVAIVGPTRMDYERVIEAVRHVSGFLSETMRDKD